jgi:hypothetical protein
MNNCAKPKASEIWTIICPIVLRNDFSATFYIFHYEHVPKGSPPIVIFYAVVDSSNR